MSTDLYREVRGAGPVLLLIPGGNGDAGFYEPFAKALSGDFTVISYDRRGFSRSPIAGPVEDDRLLDVDVDDAGVLALAAEVGSDVPFCVQGGAAWMRGRGEIIEPVSVPTGLAFVVAIPPFRLSTPDVYKAWDKLGGPTSERVVPAPRRLAPVISELVNDLEPAAEALEPRLVEFRNALEGAAGAPALLAGSGSAYVVPVADARKLPTLVDAVSRRLRVPVVGTTSVSRGVRLSS